MRTSVAFPLGCLVLALGNASIVEPLLNASFLMPADFPSMHLVTWSINYADVPDEPVMHPHYDWDEEIGGKGTILVDPIDGLYKAWYVSQPGIDTTTYNRSEGAWRMISYAYSEDGVNWVRPMLDIVPWKGQPSNLLLELPHGKECDYASVFVDPTAKNASRRYEMLALLSVAPPGFPQDEKGVIYRYYSPDGTHWSPAGILDKGPCRGRAWCGDSLYINKMQDGSYHAIIKHGSPSGAIPGGLVPYDVAAGSTRWIFVSNSTDGENWEPVQLAFSPDWRDPPAMQVISSISTIEAKDGTLVGWLPVFDSLAQTIDMQFIASRDGGLSWWRPDRRSAIVFKELGYYGGGMMWPYRRFVPDRDDPTKLHAYFSGCQGRHADIHSTLAGERFAEMRSEWISYGEYGYSNIKLGKTGESYSPVKGTNFFRGALMRATWDSSRLWALIPAAGGDIPGQAVTGDIMDVQGKQLIVNLQVHNQTRTKEMGYIAAELLDSKTKQPLAGFQLKDCIPAQRDSHAEAIRWKGGDRVPSSATTIRVRFVLLRSRLYSFQWSNREFV